VGSVLIGIRSVLDIAYTKSEKPFPVKPKRWGKRVLFDVRDLDGFADSLPYGQ